MSELAFASVRTLLEKLRKKEINSRELLSYYLQRMHTHDKQLGSALELFDVDSILESSPSAGPLAGIPGLIKDNICQKNRITSCASKILENYKAPYDATVISRLKEQGALLMGRANCDEFAMGSSNENSAYYKVANPWDLSRVSGGSSGGSAAAVAAGLTAFALGSETGGSVRQPAAFCGVVGSKPTYGLVSRYGLVAYASSLDQVGVVSRTVYDNALILQAMAGHDAHDSSTLQNVHQVNYISELTGKIKPGLKIGIIENAFDIEGIDPEVKQLLEDALRVFERLGAQLVRITLPSMDYAAAVYFMISRAEAASNLARFDGVRYGFRCKNPESLSDLYTRTRREGFGFEVIRRILIGNYVLSAGHADQYYQSAKKVQALMRAHFVEAFKTVDLLFSPVSPTGAFKFGAFDDNRLAMDLQDYFTASANLTGIPAVSVPCGFTSQKLPVGLQLMGPHLSEGLIFQTLHAYEQATEWHTMHPEQFI